MMPLEKLGLLEQRVTQMIELVKNLQARKSSLEGQVTELTNQVQVMAQDLGNSQQELNSFTQLKEENQRFQEERGQVYAKLEAMLSGLDGIGI